MNIKDNTKMQEGISFLNLIENKKILIPKIQRDYAQGRLDRKATEIRDSFLTSIFETLTTENSSPLLLDFIYGSTKNDTFIPLDGQQRLTTLFLLHWYFIPESKKPLLFKNDGSSNYSLFTYETRISSKDFCNALVIQSSVELMKELENYKLSLQTQIGQAESILHELENKSPIELSDIEKKRNVISQINILKNEKSLSYLSTIIKDQPWFLWSWRKDPTVKAMLVMLDEIDARVKNIGKEANNAIWEQLEQGKIIFHLLPLEQFALTDELYVKMNARGKELSQFDIFKSTLEEQMRLNEVSEEIQNEWRENIDSNWIDFFWNKLAKPHLNKIATHDEEIVYVKSVENGYLRFFSRMIVFHLFINDDCLECDWNNTYIKRYVPFEYDLIEKPNFAEVDSQNKFILNNIRDYSVRNDVLLLMPLFCKAKFFSDAYFNFIINFFKSIVYTSDNFKHDGTELIENIGFESKKNLFDSFISERIEYETRVQFFALLKFFEFKSAQEVYENREFRNELNAWMRLIRNLSTNTNSYFYNGYDDFLKSLKSIETWASSVYSSEGNQNINDYIKSKSDLDGFNAEQLNEEKIKVDLISHDDWRTTVIEAEEHPYFLGQIRFLLEWSKVDDKYDISAFNEYKSQCFAIFDKDGLKNELSENHLFRTALMTVSRWYLLNNCFMQNTSKHRDWSWKRYLRESEKSKYIKELIDLYQDKNKSFADFCIEQKNNLPSDWRRLFIEIPEIFNKLYDHKISWWNWDNEEICLLSKTRWSSKHKELKTYYLYRKFRESNDYYLDSTHESQSFSAVFKRDNNKEFSIKFIPRWNNGWIEGQYVVISNFDSEIKDMQLNQTSNRWEKYVNSSKFEDVEEIIKTLNSK